MRASLCAVAVTGLGATETSAHAVEVITQLRLVAVEALGGPFQVLGDPVGAGSGARAEQLLAADLVVGAQVEPGSAMTGGRKA